MKHGIHILKQPGSHQINFTGTTLFSRRPIKPDRTLHIVVFHPVPHGYGRCSGSGTKEMMSAGMPALFTLQQLPTWNSCLADAWQRVELRKNTDDRFPLPKTCDKRGWNPGNARLNFKTIFGQNLLQFGGTAGFEVPQLCIVPKFQRKAIELFTMLVHIPKQFIRIISE